LRRIAVERIVVEREYLVDIPAGEDVQATLYRVAQQTEGVSLIPNSERFIDSQSIALRDLKVGEADDFVLVQMEQLAGPPTKTDAELAKKRGRPRKTGVDTPEKRDIIVEEETEQDRLDIINSLL